MRKVILQMAVSLDGYVARHDRDLSWIFPNIDEDLEKWILESLSGTDTQLIGGINYQEQAQYWPDATVDLAPIINGSMKIVFSSTLDKLDWSNSRLAEGTPAEEIAKLKEQPGKDIFVPGGAGFVQSLSSQGLIDEYRLLVMPLGIGTGMPLFKDPIDLKLLSVKSFSTGALVLTYVPAKAETD